MSSTSTQPDRTSPHRSLRALGALRQKLRRVFLADGVATVAVCVLGALFLSFVCDYYLHLPAAVRFVFLAAGVISCLLLCARRVVAPVVNEVSTADLAKLVERSHPGLKESLLTAVELTSSNSRSAPYASSALLGEVVRGVEERVASIDFSRIFDLRGVVRKVVLCGLAIVAVAGFAMFTGSGSSLLGTWFRRNVLLGAEDWPKKTEIELVSPSQNPAIVAIGDSLPVEIRLLRGSPSKVVVDAAFAAGRNRRRDTLAEAASGTYRRVFPNVTRPFEFYVEAEDDRTDVVRVEVRLRPRIDMESIRLWCEYPSYTQWVDTAPQEPLRFGNLRVPVGTQVRYEMAANVPVTEAYFLFAEGKEKPAGVEGAEVEWPGPGAVPLALSENQSFSGAFTVEGSGQYYFQFKTTDGFPSVRPDRFRVDAIPDLKPVVKVLEPERSTEDVSPTATVTVLVSASDDYGIARGELVGLYFPPGSDDGEALSLPLPALAEVRNSAPAESGLGAPEDDSRGDGRDTLERRADVRDELVLSLPALMGGRDPTTQVGARFQFRVQVTDSAGNIGESAPQLLRVVAPEEMLRILTDRLMVSRDQLQEVIRRQRSARQDLAEFHKQSLLKEALEPEQASRLMRHRQDQERVTASLEREAEEMQRILGKMVSNRVGEEKWRNWVGGLRRDLSELAEEASPEIEKELSRLERETAESAQDPSRLVPVTSAQRQLERDVESLVLRLTEFGDFNALVELLRQVRRRQVQVRDTTQLQLGGGRGSQKEP